VAAGVSRATWYRHRETQGETPADPIAASLTSTYRVGASLTLNLTPPPGPPPLSRFPTAEARQLATLAAQLGLEWAGDDFEGWERPSTWYRPADRPLGAAAQAAYDAAVSAAATADIRRYRVEASRNRRISAVASTTTSSNRLAAAEDPQACPARVRPAVWAAVPPDLRPRVRRLAGRFFLAGQKPDAAVAAGVDAARREVAAAQAIAAEAPGTDAARVRQLAEILWHLPTATAAAQAVDTLAAQDRRRQDAEVAVAAAVATAAPAIPETDARAVAAKAVDLMCGFPEMTAAHAVRLARGFSS